MDKVKRSSRSKRGKRLREEERENVADVVIDSPHIVVGLSRDGSTTDDAENGASEGEDAAASDSRGPNMLPLSKRQRRGKKDGIVVCGDSPSAERGATDGSDSGSSAKVGEFKRGKMRFSDVESMPDIRERLKEVDRKRMYELFVRHCFANLFLRGATRELFGKARCPAAPVCGFEVEYPKRAADLIKHRRVCELNLKLSRFHVDCAFQLYSATNASKCSIVGRHCVDELKTRLSRHVTVTCVRLIGRAWYDSLDVLLHYLYQCSKSRD